ncbi:MAG: hypothetical protein IRY99_04140 [Isosphaeraceae bacterium]|nr:hypothetical protein [Isosphaeraceae bacterium]
MRRAKMRWIVLGLVLFVLVTIPGAVWVGLSLQPAPYRNRAMLPRERRKAEAKRFVAQSLQLRNDIANEPAWEAAFSDEEVNAWLAEDLVVHFADQIPPGVSDPCVSFEADRVTLYFQMDEGPVRSVISIVARPSVPEGNTLALTLESIRAGIVPIAPERFLDTITEQARRHGLEIRWERDGDRPVALLRYTPDRRRQDVVLEKIQVLNGQIRLAGRSDRIRGTVVAPTLPTRRVLQSTFPSRRKIQRKGEMLGPMSLLRSSAMPRT